MTTESSGIAASPGIPAARDRSLDGTLSTPSTPGSAGCTTRLREDGEEQVARGNRLPSEAHARLGHLEAEVLDLRLRLAESRVREARLRELVARSTEDSSPSGAPSDEDEGDRLESAALQEQLRHFSSLADKISRSLGWRFVQRVRGLVGRRWTARPEPPEPPDSGRIATLRREVDDYAVFVQAVYASRGWRLLQRARGLIGRRW